MRPTTPPDWYEFNSTSLVSFLPEPLKYINELFKKKKVDASKHEALENQSAYRKLFKEKTTLSVRVSQLEAQINKLNSTIDNIHEDNAIKEIAWRVEYDLLFRSIKEFKREAVKRYEENLEFHLAQVGNGAIQNFRKQFEVSFLQILP